MQFTQTVLDLTAPMWSSFFIVKCVKSSRRVGAEKTANPHTFALELNRNIGFGKIILALFAKKV